MKKLSFEKLLGLAMLLFAVGFNLWLYRLEPTAKVDPNDNAFQFALVDRTNTIWDFANKKCSSTITGILTYPLCHFSLLADHWVHNWAEGYNLPYYYSHIPQIAIVASHRFITLFVPQLTLFQYYHIVIYLLLCFVPIPVFFALSVMGLPWLTAGIGALLATHLSTDGLYGLDPSSFLWRGYGLSSQLFAMIWLPLALAFSFRFFTEKEIVRKKSVTLRGKTYVIPFPTPILALAVFFVTATTTGHLGIGMITMLSLGFLAAGKPLLMILRQESLRDIAVVAREQLIRLSILAGISIFFLSYWIVPTFLRDNYHNISFWDPVWKFNSYGWKETMIRLFNGDLFDFGRKPYVTLLTLLGSTMSLLSAGRHTFSSSVTQDMDKKQSANRLPGGDAEKRMPTSALDLSAFSFLFIFWLLFYFGRTTWGGLIDLIPGMKDFHLSRFLVGLHVSGMLLAPIGIMWMAEQIVGIVQKGAKKYIQTTQAHMDVIRIGTYIAILALIIPPVYQWTITYNKLNNTLIVQANKNYALVASDEQKLFTKLRSLPPGRIFAGRGGGFGKDFRVAETPYYMQLSTYGLPTTLWLPETWSMNSDTEQYFSEGEAKDYDLYNMRWVAAPPNQEPQPFWKLTDQTTTWKLYEVPTTGYFTTGIRPAVVATNKRSFVNAVHLWIQSDMPKLGLYPELTFDTNYPKTTGLPNFKMLDEVTYITPDERKHNVWTEPPVYLPQGFQTKEQLIAAKREQYNDMTLVGPESVTSDMVFKTTVRVGDTCRECMVILKQTYHPNWRATIDGISVKPISVFPFFIGVPVSPGTHEVIVRYEPSRLKVLLLTLEAVTLIGVGICFFQTRKKVSK